MSDNTPSESQPLIRSASGTIKPHHTKDTHQPLPKDIEISRIAVVEQIYYQQIGNAPLALSHRYTHWCNKVEQPYKRIIKVTQEWQSLDFDPKWINPFECALFYLVNEHKLEGKPPLTHANRAINRINTIQISLQRLPSLPDVDIIIPPGQSSRFTHTNLTIIKIRSDSSDVKCTLHLLPD